MTESPLETNKVWAVMLYSNSGDVIGGLRIVRVGDADRVKGRHTAAEQRCGRQDRRQRVR